MLISAGGCPLVWPLFHPPRTDGFSCVSDLAGPLSPLRAGLVVDRHLATPLQTGVHHICSNHSSAPCMPPNNVQLSDAWADGPELVLCRRREEVGVARGQNLVWLRNPGVRFRDA